VAKPFSGSLKACPEPAEGDQHRTPHIAVIDPATGSITNMVPDKNARSATILLFSLWSWQRRAPHHQIGARPTKSVPPLTLCSNTKNNKATGRTVWRISTTLGPHKARDRATLSSSPNTVTGGSPLQGAGTRTAPESRSWCRLSPQISTCRQQLTPQGERLPLSCYSLGRPFFAGNRRSTQLIKPHIANASTSAKGSDTNPNWSSGIWISHKAAT
jgi:hypothetical protein